MSVHVRVHAFKSASELNSCTVKSHRLTTTSANRGLNPYDAGFAALSFAMSQIRYVPSFRGTATIEAVSGSQKKAPGLLPASNNSSCSGGTCPSSANESAAPNASLYDTSAGVPCKCAKKTS